jgi:hypothetical protein
VIRRRTGFDEKKLAAIRKHEDTEAFFSSVEDFKDSIKSQN